MLDMPGRPYPLRWSGPGSEQPVWPREPDINAIRSLAEHHLLKHLGVSLDRASLEVSFFAEGAFNKLYQISDPGLPSSYLLRVTLPVEPFFKTESEVATIAYLQANTSLPVPQIIAWESSLDGDLGFEWILMEKIQGVPLIDVWRKIPWDRKLELVEEVARFVNELDEHKFDSIGGLYFKSALHSGTGDAQDNAAQTKVNPKVEGEESWITANKVKVATPERHQELMTQTQALHEVVGPESQVGTICDKLPGPIHSGGAQEFIIGRYFDVLFFKASRYYLPGDRGPYSNSLEWLTALVRVQLEWIKNGPVEGDYDYGRSFKEEAPKMQALCHEYLDALPSVFAEEKAESSNIIYHDDLNHANILVHPETFEITGIVDWEMVNVVPAWRATMHPKFLQEAEPFEDEDDPPIPDYEDEDDTAVRTRDRWDYRLLRNHWDATMKRLKSDDAMGIDCFEAGNKSECAENIAQLTDVWNWAEMWLKKFKAGKESPKDGDGKEAATEPEVKESEVKSKIDEHVPSAGGEDIEKDDSTAEAPANVKVSVSPPSGAFHPEAPSAVKTEFKAHSERHDASSARVTEHPEVQSDKQEEGHTPGIVEGAARAISNLLKGVASLIVGETKTEAPTS